MSRTMIVGDVHLGKGLSIGRPGLGSAMNSRVIDQRKLLDWVLEQAIENNVETLIFTGDICEDPKPDYTLFKIFLEFLKACEVNNMDVHIIAGNHDIRRTGSHYISILDIISTSEFADVHVYKQTNTIYKEDVCFTLLPYRDRRAFDCGTNVEAIKKLSEQLPYELADIPTNCDKVLIGHLALEGSLFIGDEIDDLANELMCPISMFEGYDYVWMGHIHKPQVRSKTPYVAHIGSMDISDFGETDHTKIIVIYDTKDPNKFTELKIPSRPLRHIELSVPAEEETTDFIISNIKKIHAKSSLKEAIVRLEVKLSNVDSKNANRVAVEKVIYELGAHYICNFSESRNISVVPLNKEDLVDNTISPKSAIKLWADKKTFENEIEKSTFIDMAMNVIVRSKNK